MSVTAKARVYKSPAYTEHVRLDFTADYNDGRNKAWASATPVFNLTMYVTTEAAEKFDQGAAYVVTFDKEDDSA